ncbi:MAG: hypothetical protein KKC51_14775 [Verrucomicrobia bacterium]|nr:hypothetical protein [Verrucomicrobiota bacterium]
MRAAGSRSWLLLPYLVLAAGAGLRIAQYLNNRSLWVDEVSLAINIVRRDFAGLFEPLKSAVAPPLFLVVVKAITLVLGPWELGLRLLPLIGSLAGLVLLWKVAGDLLPRGFAVVALAFMAFSYRHVYFCQEVKPYGLDSAAALLLLWMIILPGSRPLTWRRAVGWGLLGAATAWLSFASVFVLGGTGLALAWAWWRQPQRRVLPKLAVTAACWAIGAFALYHLSFRSCPRPRQAALEAYWSGSFLPWPTNLTHLADIRSAFIELVGYYGFTPLSILLVLLLGALGAGVLWKSRPLIGQAMVLTFLLSYLGSALHLYPLEGRLTLHLMPFLYLLVAAGAEFLCRHRHPALAVTVLVLLLAPFLAANVPALTQPIQREEIKPLLALLEKRLEPGDLIAVHYKSRKAFYYYWSRYKLGDPARVLPGTDGDKPLDVSLEEIAGRRVWLLITHAPGDDEAKILRKLPPGTKWIETHREPGASLRLFQFPERMTE